MSRTLFWIIIMVSCLALRPAFAQQPLNFGYLAKTTNAQFQSLEFAHSDSGKAEYDISIAATGGLIASDDRGMDKTILGTSSPVIRSAAKVFNHFGDLTDVAPALGLLYLTGGKTNENFAWKASVAVLKAGAVGLALKDAVGRERPNGPGNQADVFKPFSGTDTYSSFPSGHTLVAFSVATVWADEKPRERFAAYGIASLVGLSRVYSKAHWPSDVFFGALLGISQGRQAFRGNTNLLSLKF